MDSLSNDSGKFDWRVPLAILILAALSGVAANFIVPEEARIDLPGLFAGGAEEIAE